MISKNVWVTKCHAIPEKKTMAVHVTCRRSLTLLPFKKRGLGFNYNLLTQVPRPGSEGPTIARYEVQKGTGP